MTRANFFGGPTFDLEIYRTRVKGHLKRFNPKATQKVCGIAVPPAFIEKSFLVWFKASTAYGYGTARGKKTLLCIHVNVLWSPWRQQHNYDQWDSGLASLLPTTQSGVTCDYIIIIMYFHSLSVYIQ